MAKVGRKGKYEQWLTSEGLTLIEGWARTGLNDEQIAKNMGIVVSTLYDWKNKFEDFSEALRRGKEVVDFEVENALLKSATGYTVMENGKEKYIPPNPTAIIFWLKNRKPDVWRDRKDIDMQANIRNNPYEGLTEDQLKKLAGSG